MSIHRSLHISPFKKKKRSVLKRYEKIRKLKEQGKWKEGDSLFHLPKVKITTTFKIKKEAEEIKRIVKDEIPELIKKKHRKTSRDITGIR